MSEGFPSNEGHKVPTKEVVIESLKLDPSNFRLLNEYLDSREQTVKTSKDTLVLNIEIAHIYRDAGLLQHAQEALSDAAEQAFQEGEDELSEELAREAEALRTS